MRTLRLWFRVAFDASKEPEVKVTGGVFEVRQLAWSDRRCQASLFRLIFCLVFKEKAVSTIRDDKELA